MVTTGHKGKWRVYYNMHTDFPFVFSVDDGDPEREGNFTAVTVHGMGRMMYDPSRQPHCWLEVAGEMVVDKHVATIWGEAHARQRTRK